MLAAIDRATFGDLPEDLGTVRGFARPQPVTPPPAAFAEGSASPDVQAADQAMRETFEAPKPSRFGPEFSELNGDPEGAIEKLTDKRAWVLTSHDVIQGTDAQPGRTSNGLTETAPPSVPGATAQDSNTTISRADQSAPDAIQAELAATRARIAETAADLGDDLLSIDFEMEGLGRVTLREMLDDIDADAAHAAVLRACAITPGGAT